jgi:hypothetical protein
MTTEETVRLAILCAIIQLDELTPETSHKVAERETQTFLEHSKRIQKRAT